MNQLLIITVQFSLLLSLVNAETIQVRDALVQFMAKLSPGDNQKQLNWGWNMTSDPCNDAWKGVTCYNNSPTIKKIELDKLNLTGIFDATSLCVAKTLTSISLTSNNIVGTLPEEILKCSRLTNIYLHGNHFSGNLPASLSLLGNLMRLDLSENRFSGEIPDLSRISGLLTFLAQDNEFNGGLPRFDFSNLEDFNVSNNNLSGLIPDAQHFNDTSFLGNPGLCGKPLFKACPPSPAKKKGLSKKHKYIYGGYAAIGLIIVCVVGFKLIKKRQRKEKKHSVDKRFKTDEKQDDISITSSFSKVAAVESNRSEISVTSVESAKGSKSLVVLSSPVANVLKFEDMMRSPAELMKRGRYTSLYKVTVNEGLMLVVRRIKEWDISVDDFEKRMQRIDQVKHPNVMPILAFYCSREEKLLVYEFQQFGSLLWLLHGDESFNWGSRLSIAVKIAEALAFMHEGHQADGIAHGNLKSSNILLTIEMEPCISEYGLAEVELQNQSFLDQNDSFQQNNLAGVENNAFKADTYSFGMILLELLTGKLLIKINGYDIARMVNSTIREEWTVKIFDKALVAEGANEEQMVKLLEVALKCTNSSLESRPSIREVAETTKSLGM